MQKNPSNFLQVTHLSKQVTSGDSQITILNNISFQIKTGESVAILGASGSGKTTLLTLLAGLDLPTTGDIYFKEHRLNALNEEERALIRKNEVGFIFQSFQLRPSLTSLENVMLPLEINYVSHQSCKTKAMEWLRKVGLESRVNHYPAQLSGGEQQRVAIARAFISEPTVIFADEMTGNLDTHTGQLVTDILFSINAINKTTLVLVTHDETLAARCDRRLYLREGVLLPC